METPEKPEAPKEPLKLVPPRERPEGEEAPVPIFRLLAKVQDNPLNEAQVLLDNVVKFCVIGYCNKLQEDGTAKLTFMCAANTSIDELESLSMLLQQNVAQRRIEERKKKASLILPTQQPILLSDGYKIKNPKQR